MVADRADAAQALDDDGDLPIHPALDEALEPAELDDVEARLFDLAGLVEADGDLAVALHPGDRIDDDLARPGAALSQGHLDIAHRRRPVARMVIRTCTGGRAVAAARR